MQQETPDALKFFSNYLIPNPEEFAGNLLKAYEIGSEALALLPERHQLLEVARQILTSSLEATQALLTELSAPASPSRRDAGPSA